MPLIPRYTTIYIEWLGLGKMATSLNERERKKGMAICESSTPTYLEARLGCASREHADRRDGVHKCVQTWRNAADLYKQFDPHCRTCTQRGIFARFSVLTVSCLFARCPLAPPYHCSRYLFRIRTALPASSISRCCSLRSRFTKV